MSTEELKAQKQRDKHFQRLAEKAEKTNTRKTRLRNRLKRLKRSPEEIQELVDDDEATLTDLEEQLRDIENEIDYLSDDTINEVLGEATLEDVQGALPGKRDAY